jgi:hypothetical protein
MLKSLIWWNLLEKREAFLYEKAIKTFLWYASRLQQYLALKMKFLAGRFALLTTTLGFSLRYGSR